MKAFLLLCLMTASASSALAASYEVPVSDELKAYATFDLKDFEKKKDGDLISIKYKLPALLTGNEETIELFGMADPAKEDFYLIGEKAIAKCHELYIKAATMTCEVMYVNLKIDQAKVEEAIRVVSTSETEKIGRLEVMRSFSTDPVGIINY